jgi:O-antigen biosynthesis protein
MRILKLIYGYIKNLTHKTQITRISFERKYRLIEKSGLFDAAYYLDQNPDVAKSGADPLRHYLEVGCKERRDPNPLFDTSYYLKQNPRVAESGINPLVHYIKAGKAQRISPHILFDSSYYLEQRLDIADSEMNLLAHYLEHGAKESKNPHPLFNTSYYLQKNPDVLQAGVNPLVHYIMYGAGEGRDPNPLFDSSYYLKQNPRFSESGLKLLLHYLEHGANEGKDPHLFFNTSYYLKANPDVSRSGINPLIHYIRFGSREGRSTVPLIEHISYTPKLHIITSAHSADKSSLDKHIHSIMDQQYHNWELSIVSNSSGNSIPETIVEECEGKDQKISFKQIKKNQSITEAINEEINRSTGDYIAFLHTYDELTAHALYEIIRVVNEHTDTDVVYSDHDEVEKNGDIFRPVVKPDWSPELFKCRMYIGDLLVVRASCFKEVGLLDKDFDRIRYYEFFLRLSEATAKFRHIPKVLYHCWRGEYRKRKHLALRGSVKKLQEKAVNAHLRRLTLQGYAKNKGDPLSLHIYPKKRKNMELVSIIISAIHSTVALPLCLRSIFSLTSYPQFEVILVHHKNSSYNNNLEKMESYSIKRVAVDEDYSYSYAYNLGVDKAKSKYVIFLHSDVEIISSDWIQNLLYYVEQSDIGASGPYIYFNHKEIQDRYFSSLSHFGENEDDSLSCAHEVSVVATLCMMMRKALFLEIGGFNIHYHHLYHDVDLCLRLGESGYRIIRVATTLMRHHGSVSQDPVDKALLFDQWAEMQNAEDLYPRRNDESMRYPYFARLKRYH